MMKKNEQNLVVKKKKDDEEEAKSADQGSSSSKTSSSSSEKSVSFEDNNKPFPKKMRPKCSCSFGVQVNILKIGLKMLPNLLFR
jgi:hypothetical protein